MSNKFFNDAVIGNKNVRATFSSTGELLRAYYPSVDFKQFVDFFHVGMKVNDSAIIYLHQDINNRYNQYYTDNTNILNTEIENTYFNIKIRQTDFALVKENIIAKRYTIVNGNKLDLDLSFLVRSKLYSNDNNMVSGKVIDNGLIQYNHDFSFSIFANKDISGHRINDVETCFREAMLTDKDYIGMSNDSAVSYNLGQLKSGDQIDFTLFIYIENNNNIKNMEELEEKIENYDKVKVLKEGNATGTLVGGWLTAIADLIETEYWPDDENVILFFEEVECEPHLININLQRIKLSKKMKNIKGIVIGDFTDCEEKEYWDCIPTIEDIILNTFKEYNIPIISNMSFGHGDKHLTIPIGIKAEINSEWNYIKLLEKFKLGGK